LRVDSLSLLSTLSDDGEQTNTLTVQTNVLGETLSEKDTVALGDEVAESESVSDWVTRGETLVGHVEEGQVALSSEDLGKFFPLLLGRVYTSGVVSAGVQEDDGFIRDVLQVFDDTSEVQTVGLFIKVAVLANLQAGVTEDIGVVSPTDKEFVLYYCADL
jgi:hypothetical protein